MIIIIGMQFIAVYVALHCITYHKEDYHGRYQDPHGASITVPLSRVDIVTYRLEKEN